MIPLCTHGAGISNRYQVFVCSLAQDSRRKVIDVFVDFLFISDIDSPNFFLLFLAYFIYSFFFFSKACLCIGRLSQYHSVLSFDNRDGFGNHCRKRRQSPLFETQLIIRTNATSFRKSIRLFCLLKTQP